MSDVWQFELKATSIPFFIEYLHTFERLSGKTWRNIKKSTQMF